jgi:hypothetical protein
MAKDFKAFRQKHLNVKPRLKFTLILNHYYLILTTAFFIRRIGIKCHNNSKSRASAGLSSNGAMTCRVSACPGAVRKVAMKMGHLDASEQYAAD